MFFHTYTTTTYYTTLYILSNTQHTRKEKKKKIIFRKFVHFIMYLCLLKWNKQYEKQRSFAGNECNEFNINENI